MPVWSVFSKDLLCCSDDLLVTVPGSLKLGVPNNIVLHLDSSSSHTVTIQAYNDGKRVAYLQKVVEPGRLPDH